MDTVFVKDKTFSISITQDEIAERVQTIAREMAQDLEGINPLFVVILNGSFVFAADLLREFNHPCEVSFVRVSSYEGMQSTGTVTEVLGLTQDIKGRTVVIIEDIIDSGTTMSRVTEILKAQSPADLRICSLLVKPDNIKVALDIDYRCFEIPNDFIVGYGLDYDGLGRNLPAIYTVCE